LRGDPARAAATLREALALWRGPALTDVAQAGFAQAVIARLDELRLATLQDRIDADPRLGVTPPLIAELEGLVVEHPLREPLVARLMRALQAAGRRGAALAAYDQARSRLADQLGTDPAAELAALHLEILRAEDGQPAAEVGLSGSEVGLSGSEVGLLGPGVGPQAAGPTTWLPGPGGPRLDGPSPPVGQDRRMTTPSRSASRLALSSCR
jgi:DNA-binding SARP family transcriptional activator